MSAARHLHLVPAPPAARREDRPAAPTPPAPRRSRVAVVSPDGVGVLAPVDARRLREVADVTFHCCEEAPDLAEAVRLLDGVEVLAVTEALLPALDEDLLARAMSLRGIVVLGSARPGIDPRPLRLRGIGLAVAPGGRDRWAAHVLAALVGVPHDPVTWPSPVPDLASLPAGRDAG